MGAASTDGASAARIEKLETQIKGLEELLAKAKKADPAAVVTDGEKPAARSRWSDHFIW